MLDNEAAVGAVDITEGTNDLNKVMVKEEVIAERVFLRFCENSRD